MIERRYSLSEAARLVGVDRGTLRIWLEAEGLHVPTMRRGSKLMLTEADIERALRHRQTQPQIGWPRQR